MPKNRRQVRLVVIACLLVLIGLGAIVAGVFFRYRTLRVATGPGGSTGQKCLAAFVRTVADAYPRVHLKVMPMADLEANMKALTADEVDLAVVRSDMLPGTDGQTIAILRRDVVALIAPAHSPVETVGHLAGKTIGLVQGPASDERILDQMLEYYQVPISSVHRVVLAPGEIGPALRQKRIAAVFAVGPTGPGPLTDVVTAVVKASKGAPEIIELEAVRPWRSARPCWRRPTSPPGPLGQRRPGRPRV